MESGRKRNKEPGRRVEDNSGKAHGYFIRAGGPTSCVSALRMAGLYMSVCNTAFLISLQPSLHCDSNLSCEWEECCVSSLNLAGNESSRPHSSAPNQSSSSLN